MYSMIPNIFAVFVGNALGWGIDSCINAGHVTRTNARKIVQCVGAGSTAALFLLSTCLHPSSHALVITTVTLAACIGIMTRCLLFANLLDLAPNFVSIISSIVHLPYSIGFFFEPLFAGYFMRDGADEIGYRNYFFILSSITLIGVLTYVRFASGEVQEWNDQEPIVEHHSPSESEDDGVFDNENSPCIRK